MSKTTEYLTILGSCTLIAVFFFFPLLRNLDTHILADDGFIRPGQSDAFNFLWNYWWIQKALSLGQNPFVCDWVLPPHGIDLFFDTHLFVPTAATWPLGAAFGVVAAYNVMIVTMILGAAFVYVLFLRRTFDAELLPALLGGIFFGFSPYFLFKAHAHPNMIGAVFWAAALATLVHAYVRNAFSLRGTLVFSLFLWMTFWNSLVELFVTMVCVVLTVAVFELSAPRGAPRHVATKAKLAAVPLAGLLLSVAVFVSGRAGQYAPVIYPDLELAELFTFPRLSAFFPWWGSNVFEFWGVALPWSAAVLVVLGIVRRRRKTELLILSALLLVITWNLGDVPGRLVRSLPFGEAFRVFSRFFPFLLFFLGIFFAAGIRSLLAGGRRGKLLLAGLVAIWFVEIYPWNLNATQVRGHELRTFDAERAGYVLLVPSADYRPVHDTYQVALDMPFVRMSRVAHRSPDEERERRRRFPIVYDPEVQGSARDFYAELAQLGVTHLLFEDERTHGSWPVRGKVVARNSREILMQVPEPAAP